MLVPYEGYFKGLKPRMERMAEKLRHVHKICWHFISRVDPGTFQGEGEEPNVQMYTKQNLLDLFMTIHFYPPL